MQYLTEAMYIPLKMVRDHEKLYNELMEVRMGFVRKAGFYICQSKRVRVRNLNNSISEPIYNRLVCHLNGEKKNLNDMYSKAVQAVLDEYSPELRNKNSKSYNLVVRIFKIDIIED